MYCCIYIYNVFYFEARQGRISLKHAAIFEILKDCSYSLDNWNQFVFCKFMQCLVIESKFLTKFKTSNIMLSFWSWSVFYLICLIEIQLACSTLRLMSQILLFLSELKTFLQDQLQSCVSYSDWNFIQVVCKIP